MRVLPWMASGPMDLARWRYARGQGWLPHAHAFHELLWIERGALAHRIGDGVEHRLEPGDLAWVLPGQAHFGTALERGAVFINVSVADALVAELRARTGIPLWDRRLGARHRLTPAAVADLAALVADLDPRRAADRELLLLRIAHLLRVPDGDHAASRLPARLAAAVRDLAADGAWREGVAGLARRAGLSREHASRSVRAALGCTAAAFLADLRLRAAARALALDDAPIAQVARDFGFAGRGHFYRRFRAAFGVNPAAWRAARRASGPAGAETRTVPAGMLRI